MFSLGTESDISALRSVNPRLEVMLSLGGDTVSAHTFSSIVQSKESLANLTNSINHLYTMGTIKVRFMCRLLVSLGTLWLLVNLKTGGSFGL